LGILYVVILALIYVYLGRIKDWCMSKWTIGSEIAHSSVGVIDCIKGVLTSLYFAQFVVVDLQG